MNSQRVGLLLLLAVAGCASGPSFPQPIERELLLQPDHPEFTTPAPDTFRVLFETTAGDFVVESVREWAPHGNDRFFNLVRAGFYDGVRFFRVVDGFVAQFGLNPDTDVIAAWRTATIPDDEVLESNVRGMISFAAGDPDTRTTQLFINLDDNSRLDDLGFAPIARIVEGEEMLDEIYREYGEGAPRGPGPSQAQINEEGEAYLEREFPLLDRILTARIVSVSDG
ncbi:MAG: peptidylprolyl isomerase [Gemmatimonadota bacterium]